MTSTTITTLQLTIHHRFSDFTSMTTIITIIMLLGLKNRCEFSTSVTITMSIRIASLFDHHRSSMISSLFAHTATTTMNNNNNNDLQIGFGRHRSIVIRFAHYSTASLVIHHHHNHRYRFDRVRCVTSWCSCATTLATPLGSNVVVDRHHHHPGYY